MTFREKSITKLYVFALAAVFALTLAGCGGGGGTTDTATPMPDPPTDAQKLADAKMKASDAAMAAREAAAAAAMLAHGDDPDTAMAIAAADAAADKAEALKAAADDATDPDVAEALAAQAEDARDEAQMKLADAQTASAAAAQAAADLAATAATTKSALTKEEAIEAEAAQTAANDGGLGGSADDGTPVTTYTLTVSRDSMGTKVMITDTAMAGDDDPKFTQAMDLGDGRTMHVRTMKADSDGNVMEEVVIVSTDIDAPKATPFAMVTGQTLNVDLDPTADADNDGDVGNDLTALTVGTDPAVLALVKSSSFSAAGAGSSNVVHTFQPAANDTDPGTPGNQPRAAASVMGTYNGAMGNYICNSGDGGADCTVNVNAMGAITAMSGVWVFVPAAGATSDVPDADHLRYGFWLKKTTDKDGAVTYDEVETFTDSSVAASGALDAVSGMATYKGGAVGVYVHKTFKADGTSDATSGHFTADASLMAYFGGNDVAVSKQNTITGTIDNFELSGGEGNMWSVALESSAASTDGTHAGTAKGGVGDGSFSSTFYGSVTADADGNVPQPGSIVGEFNAGFLNGTVAGAFGARLMEK